MTAKSMISHRILVRLIATVLAVGCCFGSALADDSPFWLGFAIRDVDAALRVQAKLRDRQGLLISSVAADGPAAEAAVEQYDILLSVNGQKVGEAVGLDEAWNGRDDNDVHLKLLRAGETHEISVKPRRRPAEHRPGEPGEPPRHGVQHPYLERLGIELKPLSKKAIDKLPSPYNGGVEVADVRDGMLADMARIEKGDIIVGLDKWQIRNMADFKYVLDKQGRVNKFFLIRPSASETNLLYANIELAGIPTDGPLGLDRTLERLARERQQMIESITEIELAMVEQKLSLATLVLAEMEAMAEVTKERQERARDSYRQLQDHKRKFEDELMVIEAKLAVARRRAAELGGVDGE
jgi:hypothetical protein